MYNISIFSFSALRHFSVMFLSTKKWLNTEKMNIDILHIEVFNKIFKIEPYFFEMFMFILNELNIGNLPKTNFTANTSTSRNHRGAYNRCFTGASSTSFGVDIISVSCGMIIIRSSQIGRSGSGCHYPWIVTCNAKIM